MLFYIVIDYLKEAVLVRTVYVTSDNKEFDFILLAILYCFENNLDADKIEMKTVEREVLC